MQLLNLLFLGYIFINLKNIVEFFNNRLISLKLTLTKLIGLDSIDPGRRFRPYRFIMFQLLVLKIKII